MIKVQESSDRLFLLKLYPRAKFTVTPSSFLFPPLKKELNGNVVKEY
ncbi:MAG: hypothetical protein ACKPH7_34610 [Planktothrix sp.]